MKYNIEYNFISFIDILRNLAYTNGKYKEKISNFLTVHVDLQQPPYKKYFTFKYIWTRFSRKNVDSTAAPDSTITILQQTKQERNCSFVRYEKKQ